MSIMDTIRARHSVRSYRPEPIAPETLDRLQGIIDGCVRESDLNIQLVVGNPEAFDIVGRFGIIRGASCHISFVTEGKESDEAIGYWGQKIVLEAQEMGLNTCWAGLLSRKKAKVALAADERVRVAIAVGYGKTPGLPRKTKSLKELSAVACAETPAWFKVAMEAAQLAPTAMNSQNFKVTLHEDGKGVSVEAPSGAYNIIDLGIVKRNFELAANELGADWHWA